MTTRTTVRANQQRPLYGDHVDEVERIDAAIHGWERVAPDLDLSTMRSGLLFGRAAQLALRLVDDAFRAHGVSSAEFDLLAAIMQAEGGSSTPTDLARLAMLSPAGMTHRLDVLEKAGLVSRSPDPADRRSTRIVLTTKGRRCVLTAAEAHVAVERELIASLSTRERNELDRILGKLLRNVEKPSGEDTP